MCEPEYAAQTGEPMTREEKHRWFSERAREGRAKGMTYLRASVEPSYDPPLLLMEGWREQPDEEPEPFFFLTPVAEEDNA